MARNHVTKRPNKCNNRLFFTRTPAERMAEGGHGLYCVGSTPNISLKHLLK